MISYIRRNFLNLKTDRRGLETLEYAIIAAVFVGLGVAGYNGLFKAVNTTTGDIGSAVTASAPATTTLVQ